MNAITCSITAHAAPLDILCPHPHPHPHARTRTLLFTIHQSDIASKPLQWERIGVAFACAPKNIGHAGLTVVIVKRELLASRVAQTICPNVLNWT